MNILKEDLWIIKFVRILSNRNNHVLLELTVCENEVKKSYFYFF